MSAYAQEKAVAIKAVTLASKVCQNVFKALVNGETLTKKDKSPVTGTRRSLSSLFDLTDQPPNSGRL